MLQQVFRDSSATISAPQDFHAPLQLRETFDNMESIAESNRYVSDVNAAQSSGK